MLGVFRRGAPALLLWAILTCHGAASQAQAPPIIEMRGLSDLIGNTVVGVNSAGKIWSLYLDRDGGAVFRYSSGRSKFPRWRQVDRTTICFDFPRQDGFLHTQCKGAVPAGQGLNWITRGEVEASSQLIHLMPGRAVADQSSYRPDLNDWRDAVVVGRRLKTNRLWKIALEGDGAYKFYGSDGVEAQGDYAVVGRAICFEFVNGGPEQCRAPVLAEGRILWRDTATDLAVSEVVYIAHGKKTSAWSPPAVYRIGVQVKQIADARLGPAVQIESVVPGSPASTKDLRAGDIVMEVDGARIATPQQMIGLIQDAAQRQRKAVLLRIRRADAVLFVGVRPTAADAQPLPTPPSRGDR